MMFYRTSNTAHPVGWVAASELHAASERSMYEKISVVKNGVCKHLSRQNLKVYRSNGHLGGLGGWLVAIGAKHPPGSRYA